MARISIPYGESQLLCEVPEEKILFDGRMRELPATCDLNAEIRRCLAGPIGAKPLRELVAGKRDVVILIEDYTRHTPLDRILPILIACLNDGGISDDRISFLTAPGTHRPMTGAEIESKIGREMAGRFRVVQHDATDLASLRDLGSVQAGGLEIPVQVSAYALDADFLIGMGSIVPHPDAGFSGGAKIVQPGVCGFATTAATHLAAGLLPVIPLGDVDTPARIGMEKVAERVGLDFILNTVQNASGGVVAVVAGDFIAAHRAGVEIARKNYCVEIPARADIVIAGSSPCDADFWQASKGLVAGSFAVRDGGILIFVSPCAEGLADAHPELLRWLEMSNAEASDFIRSVDPNESDTDFVAADVALNNSRIRERCRIFTVSGGLKVSDTRSLGYEKFETLQEAVDEALRRLPGGTVGILPRSGVSLPII